MLQINKALETLYLEENDVAENGQGAVALQNVLTSTFRHKALDVQHQVCVNAVCVCACMCVIERERERECEGVVVNHLPICCHHHGRQLAFVMGAHARLGASSLLIHLEPSLLQVSLSLAGIHISLGIPRDFPFHTRRQRTHTHKPLHTTLAYLSAAYQEILRFTHDRVRREIQFYRQST